MTTRDTTDELVSAIDRQTEAIEAGLAAVVEAIAKHSAEVSLAISQIEA
jgi:hypothetical protein